VIGIEDVQERAYVVGVHGAMNRTISSLNTAHPLNCTTLKYLWDEVYDYWNDKRMEQKKTRFLN
jgi:hypothetical protein